MYLIPKFRKFFNLGLIGSFKCILKKRQLRKLQKKFDFMSWHSEGCFECRPYKKQILKIINQLNPCFIVDIGCGLGEILSKSNSKYKYGIDPDEKVIEAAMYMHPNIKFDKGDSKLLFKKINEKEINIPENSLLIASGWTHNIDKNELTEFLNESLNHFKYIIIDIFNEKQIERIKNRLDKNEGTKNYSHGFILEKYKVEVFPFSDNINQSIVFIRN